MSLQMLADHTAASLVSAAQRMSVPLLKLQSSYQSRDYFVEIILY